MRAASKILSFVSACPQLADGAYNLFSNILAGLQDLVFKRKRGTWRFPQPVALWANNNHLGVIFGLLQHVRINYSNKIPSVWEQAIHSNPVNLLQAEVFCIFCINVFPLSPSIPLPPRGQKRGRNHRRVSTGSSAVIGKIQSVGLSRVGKRFIPSLKNMTHASRTWPTLP